MNKNKTFHYICVPLGILTALAGIWGAAYLYHLTSWAINEWWFVPGCVSYCTIFIAFIVYFFGGLLQEWWDSCA